MTKDKEEWRVESAQSRRGEALGEGCVLRAVKGDQGEEWREVM